MSKIKHKNIITWKQVINTHKIFTTRKIAFTYGFLLLLYFYYYY